MATEAIRRSPHLLAEVTERLPQLREQATRPAGPEGVKRVVGSRFGIYRQPERLEGEEAAFWKDWYDVCASVPEVALEAGMKLHVAKPTSQFLPKPGELRALAQAAHTRAAEAYTIAKAALAEQQATPPPKPTPVDRERFKAQLADTLAQIAERTPKPFAVIDMPPVHAELDESGTVSAELRAKVMSWDEEA